MELSGQKGTPLLALLLALLVGYIGYTGAVIEAVGVKGLAGTRERIVAMRDTITKFEAATDSAKKELARGTVADVRKRLETYRASLVMLRRLVPERNEVPNLLDDISTRGKIRGVTLSQVVPQPVEPGPAPFDTYKYNMSVIGRYDQIGQFLADVASLQRIIVPYDVTVAAANSSAAKVLGDSTDALLEAKFQVRTYVKSPSSEGEASGS
ncbi:MAG TPA: type 4a pilus biogenesis protein PilO [Gemmatimonadales bacterium]|jgi:type IV pilus assembly protein PilO|nr:type 4a pilus biogenesis protein PilO [Gemmatimonadales bacterium]